MDGFLAHFTVFVLACFVGYIVLKAVLVPGSAPASDEGTRYTGWERFRPLVIYVLPLLSIFGVVIGAMSTGVSTPTEAAALGAAGMRYWLRSASIFSS